MAKTKIPRRIAGWKVPKPVRKSQLLKALLGSKVGREIAGQALIAAAGAAAAALIAERHEVSDAGRKGARRSRRLLGRLTEAAESAVDAAVGVVSETARSMLPDEPKSGKRKSGKRKAKAKARTEAGAGMPH